MQAAIITVGDELLAGDIDDTNATWLASQLTGRGVGVRRIITLPDDEAEIAEEVREAAEAYDAVVVTGGLGGTPDDVTMEAVAAAFDRDLVIDDAAHDDVVETLERIRRERRPDLELDVKAEASIPAGAEVVMNDVGISPGCVLENVYVFPGVPREMHAMFERVVDRFDGDLHSRITTTSRAESNIAGLLRRAKEDYGVAVGSYPNMEDGTKRIKVTGADAPTVEAAYEWLVERLGDEPS